MARRIFLDWSRPPLVQAAEWLVEHYTDRGKARLDRATVVVPTAMARRDLLECLVAACESRSLPLLPPTLLTVRHLPERLYENTKPFADELTCRLAWQQALSSIDEDEIRKPAPRYDGDQGTLKSLTTIIDAVHRELAANGLSCASVRKRLEGRLGDSELSKWRVLEQVQKLYYRQLDEMELWDQQAARNVAIHQGECRCDGDLVLVGLADMNQAIRAMVRQLGDAVTALIFTDASHGSPDREGFDDVGGLRNEYWIRRRVDVNDQQIVMVDRPHDQALAVMASLSDFSVADPTSFRFGGDGGCSNGGRGIHRWLIAVPDGALVPSLQRTLDWHGVKTYWPGGIPIRESLPWRWCRLAAAFMARPTFANFAAIVRHPDCFSYLSRRLKTNAWLHWVDEYQNKYLPASIEIIPGEDFYGDDREAVNFHRIRREVAELLAPLGRHDADCRVWGEAFASLLDKLYTGLRWPTEDHDARRLGGALDTLASALSDVAKLHPKLSQRLSSAEFLELLDEIYGDEPLVDDRPADAIDLCGWLDLPWTTAVPLAVTSMNDEVVPATSLGNPLLPDTLCRTLEIEDNQRRLARDVYLLNVAVHAHPRMKLILGRRDAQGDPLKPSRLLLATDDVSLLRRVRAFFSFSGGSRPRAWLTSSEGTQPRTGFDVPQPRDIEPLRTVNVTMFRDYLACPYRFYLKHIMRLSPARDDLEEMDAGSYGDLAHHILRSFGQSDIRDSCHAEEIAEFLSCLLDQRRELLHVDKKVPAVRVQIEGLRRRLRHFASIQAERRQAGWRIIAVEQQLEAPWEVDGIRFTIRGRIDRIDQHDDGRLAVWDYKTSDSAKSPKEAHQLRGEWIDLQLPLYRHLLVHCYPDALEQRDTLVSGYILMPNQLRETQFDQATWTVEELLSADAVATEVLRGLAANRYWPPASKPPQYSEDFSAICQDHIFGRQVAT